MRSTKSNAGFTLVEVLIGSTLAATILLAVISSYLFLGRNLTRLATQQTLEAQARRTLLYFAQDVRMASGIDITGVAPRVSPSASGITLLLPASSGTAVTYVYDSSAKTLARTMDSGASQILLTNLTAFTIHYYDTSTETVNYTGLTINQISIVFSSQTGSSANGTQTILYQVASPYWVMRNKSLPL